VNYSLLLEYSLRNLRWRKLRMSTNATGIIVLELDGIEVGEINVHSGSIAENHEVV